MEGMQFTIARKIILGFGLFMIVVSIIIFMARKTLNQGRFLNHQITDVYMPSLTAVKDLHNLLTKSNQLMTYWAHAQSRNDDPQKTELREILQIELPNQRKLLDSLSAQWKEEELVIKNRCFNNVDHLEIYYDVVMSSLSGFESYFDAFSTMESENLFYPGGKIYDTFRQIDEDLMVLAEIQDSRLKDAIHEENTSFNSFYIGSLWFAIFTITAGLGIGIVMTRSIVKPVRDLKKTLLYMGKGIYPKRPVRAGQDEIGEMAFAVNRLVDGLRKTKEFSLMVGAGNFSATYQPLSDEDELGHALIKMRDDLAANERVLEQKVVERTNEVVRQKEQIEMQKERVTELYKDLTDSINYAKRMQQAILPNREEVDALFDQNFILYKPKDIVSGDFYWFKQSGKKRMFTAVDCTGHGVPGAFMSLVGHNVLNQVTKVFTRPAQILNNLNRIAIEVVRSPDNMQTRDGMDLSFCTYDPDTRIMEFAGAQNPVYVVRRGELLEYKGDKFSIGAFEHGEQQFTNHEIELEPNDMIYMSSDGYADQFGGPRNKKFLRKKFKELLLEIYTLHPQEQHDRLHSELVKWKGSAEQVDDILVIGIRVV
jgi:serine phosphatase RsbU (regulator of sigma subunit)/HAMP domain-containing protein